VRGFASTLAVMWRLSIPYFHSEDRWTGRALLGAVISIELAIVAIHVMVNRWNARFFNALQDRNWDRFGEELLVFCVLAAALIALSVYQLYLSQWLRIRWRRWMTSRYLGLWLDGSNHYRMQLQGDTADNPDQRIAEDIQIFVDRTLSLGTGLLGAVVSLASFVVVLWTLSASAPLHIRGGDWTIPGYLVWAALFLASTGTTLAHLLGRALIKLNFGQQRFEADFRFNLVLARENSEQIALLHAKKPRGSGS
jgi:vitamin B12/bleomycin/antimicrobial peptide transport system ATP-binding/permease protein